MEYKEIEINGFRVPATYHDALRKVRDGFVRGEVSFAARHQYVNVVDGKKCFCPIGYLLTEKQLDELRACDLLELNIFAFGIMIRNKNIIAMTSMQIEHAARLQSYFDRRSHNRVSASEDTCREKFLSYVDKLLSTPNYDNPMKAA